MTEASQHAPKRTEPFVVHGERGQVQYEWHQDGWDIEVEFRPDGTIEGVYVGRA